MGVEITGEPRPFRFSWRRDWWIPLFWMAALGVPHFAGCA